MTRNNDNDNIINIPNNPNETIKNKKKKEVKLSKQFKLKKVYITGLIIGIVAFILHVLILTIYPIFFVRKTKDDTIDRIQFSLHGSPWLVILGLCIILPIIEELFFRRFTFYYISQWNKIMGYFFSALLYSICHFRIFDRDEISDKLDKILVYFIISVLLTYAYDRDRCLLASIIANMEHNILCLFVLFIII